MPTLPSGLATRAERWFGRAGTVTEIVPLSDSLRQVGFEVPALRGRTWVRGQEVEFRVDDRGFRHYTQSFADPETGRIEIVFQTTADGPGTHWVRGLRPGDEVNLMGPGGGVRHPPRTDAVFLGDGTAIGLFMALAPLADRYAGAVEVPAADRGAAQQLLPSVEVLAAGSVPGTALQEWLDRSGTLDPARSSVCLAGQTQAVQSLRQRVLLAGVPRFRISLKAHWAAGRQGL